jgi:hypothetical protein
MSLGDDDELGQSEFVVLFAELLLKHVDGVLVKIKCHIRNHFLIVFFNFFEARSRRVKLMNVINIFNTTH